MTEQVRVRFAPSPTGALHIGGGHTALFNWLWARHTGGRFILRIEDTDRERSTREYEETILAGMRWLGLDWDEGPDVGGAFGPYRQSERLELYLSAAEQLVDEGKAYRQDGAVYFRIPEGKTIAWDDAVYGPIEVEGDTLRFDTQNTAPKDLVILKSDGYPTYNYAVVVDDAGMAINTVIRGEDHIANTPKQILLYEAFGWQVPRFAHLPMILGTDKKKLSKRHGATSIYEYRDLGYLPDGAFNFLALLGWSPGDENEICSRQEAVQLFELSRVTKRAAVFDMQKFAHVNQAHLWRTPPADLVKLLRPLWKARGLDPDRFDSAWLARALELLGGRGQTTLEAAEYSDYFLSFDAVTARYDGTDLSEDHRRTLRPFYAGFLALPEWHHSAMETYAKQWGEAHGAKMKDLAMPLRWALTGRKVSPGVFDVAVFLGREEVARRLRHYNLLPEA